MSQKKSDKMAEEKFFYIFRTLGSQGREGRVDIPRNMKK